MFFSFTNSEEQAPALKWFVTYAKMTLQILNSLLARDYIKPEVFNAV